jgi:uncharacterized membrane protein
LVVGFDRPKFGGGIASELNRLKELDIVRVIDALVVHKNAQGDVRTLQATDLSLDEAENVGAVLGGLIGLGASGQSGMIAGAEAGREAVSDRGGHIFNGDETWDVLEDIPSDSAAALILLEHRWAIPLRDSIMAEGGMAVGDIWLHPQDLIAAGLIASDAVEDKGPGSA